MNNSPIEEITEEMDFYRNEDLQQIIGEYHIGEEELDLCRNLSNVRRPLVLVRGKPVAKEQAMQLITGEEPLFGEGGPEGCWFDPRQDRGVLKNIFYRKSFSWLSTWLYSDGTIGGNLIHLGKYPELDEFVPMYACLSGKYPFLDMVVSYTMYDECTCYGCGALDFSDEESGEAHGFSLHDSMDCPRRDCLPYLDRIRRHDIWLNLKHKEGRDSDECYFEKQYFRSWGTDHVRSDVGDQVVLTIHIHEGRTDLLFGGEAAHLFRKYDALYCKPEYAFLFASGLYNKGKTCICNKAFIEDCFESIGKSRSLCDEYVARGFLSPFEEEIVATKEWVTEQYRTHILHEKESRTDREDG